MKKSILLLLLAAALAGYASAQCEKEISTNPVNPVNNEFLPLKNEWYPSVDPGVSSYTVNSFLNTGMNWSPGTSIQLDLNAGWDHPFGNAGNFIMRNPFANNHHENHLNSGVGIPSDQNMRDFRWEDGWELLWMNTGEYPNGDVYSNPSPGTYFAHGNQPPDSYIDPILDAIAPPNIPYFVLYNRYRGTLRLFANVWQGPGSNTGPQEWSVTMKYTGNSQADEKISGLFRHASSIDRALDQSTEYTQIIGPRVQSINQSDWVVAEFPMAFDPCICMKEYDGVKDPGKVEFVFESIETTDIDLYSRTIEVESAIDENNLNEDFLNLSNIEENNYHPGTVSYRRMTDLLTKHKKELEKYNDDLNDYNNYWNTAKFELIDLFSEVVTTGLNVFIPGGEVFDNILKAESIGASVGNDAINSALKGLLGIGVDYAAFEAFGKKADKPVKPTSPVASFSETAYKGKLERSFYQRTTPLLLPGGITAFESPLGAHYGYGKTQLYPSIFPAYNKVLGQAALLRMPVPLIEFNKQFTILEVAGNNKPAPGMNFKLRFDEPIEIAINRSLDFDMDLTDSYFNLELVVEIHGIQSLGDPLDTQLNNGNLHITHSVPPDAIASNDPHVIQVNSEWIPIGELNQHVFSFDAYQPLELFNVYALLPYTNFLDYFNDSDNGFRIKSIRLKVLHDFYFETIGSFDEQVNTTLVNSYLLYDSQSGVNVTGESLDGVMSPLPAGSFDLYIPGTLILGDETINTTHPAVNNVIASEIIINAQEVVVNGPLTVQSGYTVVIQALERIDIEPGAILNPKVSMRIKKDFYNTPVFEYADNSTVASFCNDANAYQANTASKALRERIQAQQEQAELDGMTSEVEANNKVALYPNPANGAIQLRSSDLGISQVDVYDIAGRLLLQHNYGADAGKQVQMDIQNLQTGVYIVQIHCGAQVHKEKLVVGL